MTEGFWDRVGRHIREGKFDPHTIASGISQALELLKTVTLDDESIVIPENLDVDPEEFANPYGIDVRFYSLYQPKEKKRQLLATFDVITYPATATLKVGVLPPGEYQDILQTVRTHPEAIAGLSGPTYPEHPTAEMVKGLPNNGFYHQEIGYAVPFQDTNPSGQRRGAIGVRSTGEVVFLTDEEKWHTVNANFEGWEMVAGTSYWFDHQTTKAEPGLANQNRMRISYLVWFQMPDDSQRLMHIKASSVTRSIMQKVIESHLKLHMREAGHGFQVPPYQAHEMELNNARSVIRTNEGTIVQVQEGNKQLRRDYWMIVQK